MKRLALALARDRLAEMRADHQLAHVSSAWPDGVHPAHVCALDRQPWPCDTVLLLRDVTALTAKVERLRTALEGMVYQFGYWSDRADANGGPGLWHGGLSALEDAWLALGWPDDVHPAPEQRCDEPGCTEQSSCGWPSPSGYRRTCGGHYPPIREARAALAGTPEGLRPDGLADQERGA